MGVEIERKFLLLNDEWRRISDGGTPYVQGYLGHEQGRTVRVRTAGDAGYLTVKGKAPKDAPLKTPEFEYPIPKDDAKAMLAMCEQDQLVTKTRYRVPVEDFVFEIDVFHGRNEGLVVAEIELPSEDSAFPHPSWLGDEVTHDKRYKNARLAVTPYQDWKKKDKSAQAACKP